MGTLPISRTDTIHHVPGRLRVRMRVLRRNPQTALRASELLRKVDGVWHVETSTLTGSVLIRYDTQRICHRRILEAIAEGGFTPPSAYARPLDQMAQAAASIALDRVLERGAAVLLTAIL